MLRKNLDELETQGQKGDWAFSHGNKHLYIAIRYGQDAFKEMVMIPVSTERDVENVWFWDGDFENPTLSPSILVKPYSGWTEGWHGFLIDGKLVDA